MTWRQLISHLQKLPDNKLDGDVIIIDNVCEGICAPNAIGVISDREAEVFNLVENDPVLLVE